MNGLTVSSPPAGRQSENIPPRLLGIDSKIFAGELVLHAVTIFTRHNCVRHPHLALIQLSVGGVRREIRVPPLSR